MGAADFVLFALLGFAEAALMIHLYRRRARRVRCERMMHSLRAAIARETGAGAVRVDAPCPALVLQRAS